MGWGEEGAGTPGWGRWVAGTRALRSFVGDEVFMTRTFSGEIHPYHSENYRQMKEIFPTFEYTSHLIRNFMHKDTPILIRNQDWFRVLPELRTYKQLYQMTIPIISYITPRTVANNGFRHLIEAYTR